MAGELLILYNTLFNMMLLSFTKMMTGVVLTRRRMIVSAFVSAVVTVAFPASLLTAVISFVCLLGIAFSFRLSVLILHGGWLVIGTLLVGGFLTALQPLLLGQSIVIYGVLCCSLALCLVVAVHKGWQKKLIHLAQQAYIVSCDLTIGDSRFQLQSYIDTGNECTEPLSRAPVHFLSFPAVEQQLPSELRQALLAWQVHESYDLTMFPESLVSTIRFVPIRTVHKQKLLVPAFRMKHFAVDGRDYDGHYVVFTQNEAPFPQQVDMILHVSILTNK